jgi:Cft2 family RNA processing exonuclease
MTARLIAVSGLGAKEPAAFVVEAQGCRLLLDCGEGPEPGRRPDFDAIGRVDAIVLSHGHPDHVGALRFRDRIGSPPVYATEPVLSRLKDVSGQAIPIRGRAEILGITIETGMNGHAPGGVWLRISVGDGLLYMGDHSTESQVYAFDLPPPTPTMIIDGSYGDAEVPLDEQRKLVADIASRGPVLLPVPPDGRGPEIAIFLQDAGFDVAIDEAVRSVAAMLTDEARQSARPAAIAALTRLVRDAAPLDGNSALRGAMVAAGGQGDSGVAGALIERFSKEREPAILFTGYVAPGRTAKELVDSGRALFQRWNVHPRFADNLRLVAQVNPHRVIPAFGDSKYLAHWRTCVSPRVVVSDTPLSL